MNILFYCNEYPPFLSGGIGIFTKELAEELVKEGHNVHVFGSYAEKDVLILSGKVVNGVNVHKVKTYEGPFSFIINRVRSYLEIRNIIDKCNIDILEVQDFHGLLSFLPKLNCKVIVRLHGSVYYFKSLLKIRTLKDIVWKSLERNHLKKADRIVSVSHFTAKKTIELFNVKSDIHVIHNGVSVLMPYNKNTINKDKKMYLFSGSIIRKKGIVELINSWVEFSSGKNVQLDIYGKDSDDLTKDMLKILKDNKVDNCFFHGAVSKPLLMERIKGADFCIFPTKAEAFSLAPMEAMAMSKVVLYAKQTSASELINNSVNGLLIDSSKQIDIVKSLNESYLLTQNEYNLLSEKGYYTISDDFNVKKKNVENIKFYKSVLNSKV